MYKAAIRRKLLGAIISVIMLAAFIVAAVIFMHGTPMYITVAVLLLFAGLLFSSVCIYIRHLSEIKMKYGRNLENDVNACRKSVVGKYFFLENCLADMANARLIYYREIKGVAGMTTRGSHGYSSGHSRYAGAVVEIRTINEETLIVSDFNSGYAKDSKETIGAYNLFGEYLREAAPHAKWSE